jgi:hypothetical protein
MSPNHVTELVDLLQLERLEDNLFRGQSRDIGTRFVFGGQVLGQALAAAQKTVDPIREAHSLHAYFLRAGDIDAPIVYSVERTRDGGVFLAARGGDPARPADPQWLDLVPGTRARRRTPDLDARSAGTGRYRTHAAAAAGRAGASCR